MHAPVGCARCQCRLRRASRRAQVIEIKNKHGEPPDRIKPFYQMIEVYIKFLTLQRGKGLFYMGVGLLTFFIAPDYGKTSWFGSWGVMNVSSLALAAVGGLHTFQVRQPLPRARRCLACVSCLLRGSGGSSRRRTALSAGARSQAEAPVRHLPLAQLRPICHARSVAHGGAARPKKRGPTLCAPTGCAGGGGEARGKPRCGWRRAASHGRARLQLADGFQLALPRRQGGLMRRGRTLRARCACAYRPSPCLGSGAARCVLRW